MGNVKYILSRLSKMDYKAMLNKVNEVHKKTIIVITHNITIGEMATRVLKMRSGEIVEDIKNENPMDPERIEW